MLNQTARCSRLAAPLTLQVPGGIAAPAGWVCVQCVLCGYVLVCLPPSCKPGVAFLKGLCTGAVDVPHTYGGLCYQGGQGGPAGRINVVREFERVGFDQAGLQQTTATNQTQPCQVGSGMQAWYC